MSTRGEHIGLNMVRLSDSKVIFRAIFRSGQKHLKDKR